MKWTSQERTKADDSAYMWYLESVIFIKVKNKIGRVKGRGNGEVAFRGYRVSIMEEDKDMRMDVHDALTSVKVLTAHLKMLRVEKSQLLILKTKSRTVHGVVSIGHIRACFDLLLVEERY